jgi:hypothetical protein
MVGRRPRISRTPPRLAQPLQLQRGTTRKPKYEVFDFNRNAFLLVSGTFSFKNAETETEVANGSLSIDNSDKTIQATLDLNQTDVDVGWYQLKLRIYVNTGESQEFRKAIEVVDFEQMT